jgi:hypothetical protein
MNWEEPDRNDYNSAKEYEDACDAYWRAVNASIDTAKERRLFGD